MRILVISDTHGKIERVVDVYKKLVSEAPLDFIVHCGDHFSDAQEIRARLGVPVAAVRGNCDGCFTPDAFSVLETEYGNFLITHGHMENVGYSMQNLYYKVLENGCAGAFFGHTHRSTFVQLDDVYLMNPGSISKPRDGSGGSFGLVVTSEDSLWGKIYSYEDFMLPADGQAAYINSASFGGSAQSSQNAQKPQASPSTPKKKVKGGHLRDLLNYSDRF